MSNRSVPTLGAMDSSGSDLSKEDVTLGPGDNVAPSRVPGAEKAEENEQPEEPATAAALSHSLPPGDHANPLNWVLYKRLYASAVAWTAAYTVAFGLTCYTAAIPMVAVEFGVSHVKAILPFSIYVWGIAFAPIWTPHVSEKFGRGGFYLVSLTLCGLFLLGSGCSKTFNSLLACRFFAGFFGGPCLVLIEGTFADVWSACTTNTYYAFLGIASYFGAASGPLLGGFILNGRDWRWSQWLPCIVDLGIILFAIGMPESYNREIARREARRHKKPLNEPPALSGTTLPQMAKVTILDPLVMLFSESLVIIASLFLGLNFGVVFQWFILVPIVLGGIYKATLQQVGLAFLTAIVGASIAAVLSIATEQTMFAIHKARYKTRVMPIETRLIPAIYGSVVVMAALFWIGFTASPAFHWAVPVFGTMVYVFGNVSIIISVVPYLFDAYPPAGTLSALTAAACFRIILAGLIPMVIIQMVTGLTGAWALSTFGFISFAFISIPVSMYVFGARMRSKSRFSKMM